jgi:hypothetical protein
VRVTSRDGTVALPEVAPDRVVATLIYGPGPTIDLTWSLEGAGLPPPRPVTQQPDQAAARTLRAVAAVLDAAFSCDVRLTGLGAARFAKEVLPVLEHIDGVEVTGARPREGSG